MLDNELLLTLWGKKKEPDIHYPLIFHMLDVSALTSVMLSKSLSPAVSKFFVGFLSTDVVNTVCWISFFTGMHDIGKASPVFQRMSEKIKDQLQYNGLVFDSYVEKCPHNFITADTFADLVGDLMPGFSSQFLQNIGLAIGGHHGVFSTKKVAPLQKGNKSWHRVRLMLTKELANLTGVSALSVPEHIEDLAFYIELAGITSVADWIASNEDFFPYERQHSVSQHFQISSHLAEQAIHKLGWDSWQPPVDIETFQNLFPDIIGKPRPLQEKIIELSSGINSKPAMVIIEAPMGEGKTEAAMYLADRWSVGMGQKGCYFALPTQATSNQMYQRVSRFLNNRYPSMITNLRLIHGNAILSEDFDDFQKLMSNRCINDDPDYQVTAANWFLPKKRALLSPFGVGTIDQALLSVLQTKHYFVRLFGLAHKTVIIDEIHAYDTYMSTLLEQLIGWLRALGTSIILLSATLPEHKRRALLSAYGGNSNQLIQSRYPRITWVSDTEPHTLEFKATKNYEVTINLMKENDKDLAEKLSQATINGGCVAIICNTVKRAQAIYTTILESHYFKKDELIIIHARYPFEDRMEKEKNILNMFGKDGNRPHRAVLVATQIIEQSLDLDFDLMVTDLAPIDLVIQRIGRIHRHNNIRPDNLNTPEVWIRMPDIADNSIPDFGPSKYVYEEYFLLLSYLELVNRKSILLPDDIESLIQNVYDETEHIWPSSAYEMAVSGAYKKMTEIISRDMFKAKTKYINSQINGDIIEFFSRYNFELEEDNPEVHKSLQALTRLIEPTVQVVCLFRRPDGLFLNERDSHPIDMNKFPEKDMLRGLLRRSLSITDKRIVFRLLDQEPPFIWRKSPALRYHRLVEFENSLASIGDYRLILDNELGLLINSSVGEE